MSIKFFKTFVIIATTLGNTALAEENVYEAFLNVYDYENYIEMLDGRDPLDIEDLATAASTRMTLEPLLMQVAPVLGDCDCRVEYRTYDVATNHARTIEQVRNGHQITHGVAGFPGDSRYEDGISLSYPVLAPEDFFVGLYAHDKRDDVLSATTDEDIRKLSFAVVENWEVDRKVLENYGFDTVLADNWNSLISLLITGRADVMLQPFFGKDDLSLTDTTTNERFVPIPGIRLPFNQGRQYMVSKKHPDGPAFLEALNRGLKMLEEQGVLHAAMKNAGVINDKAEGFRSIALQ